MVLTLAPDVAAWLTCRSDLSPTLANHAAAFADLVGTTAADGGHRTDEFSFLAPVEE